MSMRFLLLLVFCLALLPGCANTKQTQQADSKSIMREADPGHDIHGEVGVMYGSGNLSRH
jgi:hypothetical protein